MTQAETVLTLKEFMARTQHALSRKDVPEAMKLASLMADSYPSNVQALHFAGTVSFEMQQYQEAVFYLLRAVGCNPAYPQAKEYLLYALFMAKEVEFTDGLVACFTEILRRSQDLNSDLVVRVWVKIMNGHPAFSRCMKDMCGQGLKAMTAQDISLIASDFVTLGVGLYLVPDMKIEAFLIALRKGLLNAACGQEKIAYPQEFEQLALSLAQCSFNNDYLYLVTESEAASVKALSEKDVKTLSAFEVAMLGAYEPLYKFEGICRALEKMFSPIAGKKSLKKIILQQIEEPLAERKLAQNFPSLSKIDDNVSEKVRLQYEENPYPKWTVPKAIHDDELAIRAGIYSKSANEILIAGCATGAYPINVARAHPRDKITGIDLSLASLCYGERKAQELKVKNLEFLHGDILKIAEVGKMFDVIETVGVLHHMKDPKAGLDALVDVLADGGYIKIGLYSTLARKHITACSSEFSQKGFKPTPEGIGQGREYILSLPEEHPYKNFMKYNDFYNTSMMRDMLFHVQERCYTIPQIKELLTEAGLEFIGFSDIGTGEAFAKYKEKFPDDKGMIILENWHIFEQDNPDTFIGMYKFWCRKN